jgi:hypothetical protein
MFFRNAFCDLCVAYATKLTHISKFSLSLVSRCFPHGLPSCWVYRCGPFLKLIIGAEPKELTTIYERTLCSKTNKNNGSKALA